MIKNNTERTVAAFIDAANFEISLKMCGLYADFKQFLTYIVRDYSKHYTIRYYKVDFQTKSQNRFFSRIKNLGFKIVTKKIKIIKQRHRKNLHKANFDVEIAFDAAVFLDRFDYFILFSGDSDFVYLISQLRKRGKKTSVISPNFRTAKELRKISDNFIDLRECPFVHKKLPLKREDHNNLSTAKRLYHKP